ncbi:PrgI family protein [Paenibacillus sp. NPDC093718]|uniref:PrgI family protein n=1 Tax=Paenibacillus sp. NPDC093718 TaxID=3390601 RepID=UPI003CFCA485
MEYFIPKNVKTRVELLPGFGIKELLIVLVGAVIGLILSFIIFFFSKSPMSFLVVVLFAALSFFLAKPEPRTGRNALDLLKDIRSFKSKPSRYYYRFGEGRE